MNSERSKLRHEQRSESEYQVQEASTQNAALQFSTVEDLLRFDNGQNPIPGDVAERLNNSIADEPKKSRPWYKSIFGS